MSRSVWKLKRQAALAAVVSALACLASAAQAEEGEPARVAWVWKTPADADCASSEQIRAEIERLSQRELISGKHEYEIEALAIFHEGLWVASVALRDDLGRILGGREVAGPYVACQDLNLPVALVVATLLDELRTVVPSAPVAPPEPKEEPKAAAQPLTVGVGAFVAGAFGLLPRLSLGFGATVELSTAWPISLTASAYLPGSELDEQGRGAKLTSFHAGAATCPRLVGQRHFLRMCGGAQVGAILAKSVALTDSERAGKPLIMVALEPQLVLGLTRSWALVTSLAANVPITRPEFHWDIEGAGRGSATTEPFVLIARIGIIDFVR